MQKTRGVVAVQHVHLDQRDRPRVERQHSFDLVAERAAPQRPEAEAAGPVLLGEGLAAEEAEADAGEEVVHHGVRLVATQPPMGLVPDFAHDVRLGVRGLDSPPKLAPELVVVNLRRHIEPPAVNPELDPILGHAPEELAHSRRGGVELGQRGEAPPALIVRLLAAVGPQRPTLHREPVQVGRIGAVFQDVVELKEAAAGVVEDAIQDHANAAGVRGIEQRAECRVAAEHRVHLVVVVRVIAMVRPRPEDRVEVDGVDPQVGQVVQVFGHAEQIAALVAVRRGRRAPRLQAARLWHRVRFGETIRENLVENGVLDPFGGLDFGHDVGS